jgi:hypothetical protein
VPAGAAADIDDLGSGANAEPVEIHRQQGSATASTALRRWAFLAIARS